MQDLHALIFEVRVLHRIAPRTDCDYPLGPNGVCLTKVPAQALSCEILVAAPLAFISHVLTEHRSDHEGAAAHLLGQKGISDNNVVQRLEIPLLSHSTGSFLC